MKCILVFSIHFIHKNANLATKLISWSLIIRDPQLKSSALYHTTSQVLMGMSLGRGVQGACVMGAWGHWRDENVWGWTSVMEGLCVGCEWEWATLPHSPFLPCTYWSFVSSQSACLGFTSRTEEFLSPCCVLRSGQALPGAATRKLGTSLTSCWPVPGPLLCVGGLTSFWITV